MDEVNFGPRREARWPSRRLRALAAAASIAAVAAAGAAFAVTEAGAHHAMTGPALASQPAALPAPLVRLPSPGCPPAHTAWPNLASLPAGMRTAARPIIIDEQFSGQCPAR
jgi:acyl-CoA thioesterase